MAPSRKTEPKAERIELRAGERQAFVIRHAADAKGTTVTAFVLDAACLEAQRTLADRRLFHLDPDAWERFARALDRAPKRSTRPRAQAKKRR